MLDKLTATELNSVIAESVTLRAFIVRTIQNIPAPLTAEMVVDAVRQHGGKGILFNKIGAIKAVRLLGTGHQIRKLYPFMFSAGTENGDSLGLADSKKLVEQIAWNLGID